MHAGVTSVLMNVFEGLAHARVVRLQDRFLHHVIAVRPQQTDTFRRAERQIEPVVITLGEPPPTRPIRRDPIVEPTGHSVQIRRPSDPVGIR